MKRIKEKIITIGEVARELGIKPAAARGKLRKAGLTPTKGRWMFVVPSQDLRMVEKILLES